jgi:phospholipase/lecithinase/hemolysin
MPFQTLSRLVAALCGAGLLAAAGPAAAVVAIPASPFSSLYVFGDSLSDSGNLFAMSGNTIPDARYYQGRFSNGIVAAEVLANGLGLNNTVQFHNFAIAGAQTGTGGSANAALGTTTGMRTQVNGYLTSLNGGSADSGGLYMVWGGANDLLQANLSTLLDPNARAALVATSIGNLVGEVGDLYAAGARNFLLPLLPDIGKTPYLLTLSGGAFSAAGSQIAAGYNAALLGAYGQLAAALPSEHFITFDTYAATNAVIPLFSNATGQCLADGAYPACTGYMFFDDRHPTAATHALLGQQMLAAAVPEPQTMLLMATGALALLGLQRRRQRAAA